MFYFHISVEKVPKTFVPHPSTLKHLINNPNLKLINKKSCGKISSQRIIGGHEAELGEFPWM